MFERGAGEHVLRVSPRPALLALSSALFLSTAGAGFPAFPALQRFTIPLDAREQLDFAHPSGGTGDPQASGSVTLTLMPVERQVCYDFSLRGADGPMMAHIHRGRPLQNGPPIVTLFTGPGASLQGCAAANTGQLAEIIADPADYYVELATTGYPDGALRGQLRG